MEYRVTCGCGKALAVSEGAAGSAVACPCGRSVEVPSLRELRRLNGVADTVNPVLVIEQLLAAGGLPPGRGCTRCGRDDAEPTRVTAECERKWTRRHGRWEWLLLLVSWPAALYAATLRAERPGGGVDELGRDVILHLPLRLCPACRPELRRRAALSETLRQVPVYAQLLDRYPAAKLSLPET